MLVDLDNGHFNNRQIEPAVTIVVGDDMAQCLGLGNLVLYRMICILNEVVASGHRPPFHQQMSDIPAQRSALIATALTVLKPGKCLQP